MQSIIFDDGYRNYAVNGDENRVVRVHVADLNLKSRLEEMLLKIDLLAKKYGDKIDVEQLTEADAELRPLINFGFGTDVCTPAFGTANLFSPVGDGTPLYQNFLDAFVPVVTENIKEVTQKIRPEVQKYLPKSPDVDNLSEAEKTELLKKLLS